MDKAEKAREWALSRVGCPYIMGGTGQFCTVAYRKARAAQYPGSAAKIRENCPRMQGSATSCRGCRWWDDTAGTGKRAYDCAQLTRWCMDAVGIKLVSGATSQWTRTAWAERGEIDSLPGEKLCLVFRQDAPGEMGHVGLYLGDGTVVHAKGHAWGVIRQKLGEARFTHWGVPAGLYAAQAGQDGAKDGENDGKEGNTLPNENAGNGANAGQIAALRRGDKGEAVRALQTRLLSLGLNLYQYGADGSFGAETEAAVRALQAGAGLAETGAMDAATWAALDTAEAVQQKRAETRACLNAMERELKNARAALQTAQESLDRLAAAMDSAV